MGDEFSSAEYSVFVENLCLSKSIVPVVQDPFSMALEWHCIHGKRSQIVKHIEGVAQSFAGVALHLTLSAQQPSCQLWLVSKIKQQDQS